MLRRLAFSLLIALQVLAALAWPAKASARESVQHRLEHVLLTQHHHDKAAAHHHDHHGTDSHDADPQLSDAQIASLNPSSAPTSASADHHHHLDTSVSMALVGCARQPLAQIPSIQNPCIPPAMHSADVRLQLRPPQA